MYNRIVSIKTLLEEEDRLVREYNNCIYNIEHCSKAIERYKDSMERYPALKAQFQTDIDRANTLIISYSERLPSIINDINNKREAMREKLVI